jgi:hypothetical protein
MSLKGTITHLLEIQSGVSKAGKSWQKREFVITTEGQYPKQVCLAVWGDSVDKFPLTEGNNVECEFDAESREYNGRWFTELKCYKMDVLAPAPIPVQESSGHFDLGADDNLPF